MNLRTIATIGIGETKSGTTANALVSLNIAQGSVLDFSVSSNEKTKSLTSQQDSFQRVGAIVNAANEGCLGGGGVDGAINSAGGPSLRKDREALPFLSTEGERCHTGGAVVTGPGRYGNLRVNYVVHAVGPVYDCFSKENEPDALLRSAYQESLERCREKGITDVAFSLLSAGVFRGNRSLYDVLAIGVIAIRDWVTDQEKTSSSPHSNDDNDNKVPSSPNRLQSVTLCCYLQHEVDALTSVCRSIFENNNYERNR